MPASNLNFWTMSLTKNTNCIFIFWFTFDIIFYMIRFFWRTKLGDACRQFGQEKARLLLWPDSAVWNLPEKLLLGHPRPSIVDSQSRLVLGFQLPRINAPEYPTKSEALNMTQFCGTPFEDPTQDYGSRTKGCLPALLRLQSKFKELLIFASKQGSVHTKPVWKKSNSAPAATTSANFAKNCAEQCISAPGGWKSSEMQHIEVLLRVHDASCCWNVHHHRCMMKVSAVEIVATTSFFSVEVSAGMHQKDNVVANQMLVWPASLCCLTIWSIPTSRPWALQHWTPHSCRRWSLQHLKP